MQRNFRSSLDVISSQILFQLSSKQALSIPEIARAIDQSLDSVNNKVIALQRNNYVENKNGELKISRAGLALIHERGGQIPRPSQSSQPRELEVPVWIMFFPVLVLLILILSLAYLIITSIKNPQISTIIASIVLAAILVTYIIKSFQRVSEYERIVVFRMGKCVGAGGPGLVLILPIIDRSITVDLRVNHQAVPHETCITKDTIQVGVDFVFYWTIQQPVWSVTKITDAEESIKLLATALLRAVIADFLFDDVLNHRDQINDFLKNKINEICSEWGVHVDTMEIREIKPPEEIMKSIHKLREAEWLRQASAIDAEAQAEALRLLTQITALIENKTLNVKSNQIPGDSGPDEATKYIFPLELTNLIRPIIGAYENGQDSSETVIDKQEDSRPEQTQDPSDILG